MNRAMLAVDVLLIAGLVGLAVQAVAGRTLFRSMIMFIVFSFAMALAWVRLNAPDLALAEAAIGAGITGALVMVSYQRLLRLEPRRRAVSAPRRSRLALPVAVVAGALVAAIGWAAMGLGEEAGTAGLEALDMIEQTGVHNPVTAVLVVFRNYDTLLEITVLLVALLSARAVAVPGQDQTIGPLTRAIPLVAALQAVIVPFALLVAGYLLRTGSHAPGGAFQAGAVLAAGCVLLLLTGQLRPSETAGAWVRTGILIAVVGFVLLGYANRWWGAAMLAMPGAWSVYLIETAMMFSIGLTLALLFSGSAGLKWQWK